MRRNKRAGIAPNAWLFGIGVPVVGLFALFSLMPYSAIMARWPMGIGDREKNYFQKWFDQRPGTSADTAKAEVYELAVVDGGPCVFDGGEAGKEVDQRFTAEGFSGTVQAAPTAQGGVVLRARDAALFRGQGSWELNAADVPDLATKYLEVIAAELEVASPTVSFVHVNACGKDRGVYMAHGILDETYLKRNHMAHRALVSMPLDATDASALTLTGNASAEMNDAVQHRLRATASARNLDELAEVMDVQRFAAQVLLAQVRDGAKAADAPVHMTYDPAEGLFHPLFDAGDHAEAGANKGVVGWGVGALLAQPAFVQLVKDLAQKARSNETQIQERLDLVDRTWLPILAQGRPVGMVEAQAHTIRENLLQRLWGPDLAATYGTVHPLDGSTAVAQAAPVLDPWLDQYRQQGDTLRFTRGKYTIDHDLVIPRGYSLVLEKGTRFFMAPGKSIVVHGALIARGTGLNPVFIRPQEAGLSYGTLAVMGDGHTRCSLRGVLMSGGSGAWVNGVHFEGMLSAHRADLSLENCTISDGTISVAHGQLSANGSSFSADLNGGLSVSYGSALLKECSFTGAQAWDSTMAVAPGSVVRAVASKLFIDRSRFADLNGTAIVAGEASQVLIARSGFEHVARAVRAEDLSVVHVSGNTFNNNGVLFTGRCADPVFGGAYFTLYENMLEGNLRDRDLDSASTWVSKTGLDASVRQAFGFDNMLETRDVATSRRGRRRSG